MRRCQLGLAGNGRLAVSLRSTVYREPELVHCSRPQHMRELQVQEIMGNSYGVPESCSKNSPSPACRCFVESNNSIVVVAIHQGQMSSRTVLGPILTLSIGIQRQGFLISQTTRWRPDGMLEKPPVLVHDKTHIDYLIVDGSTLGYNSDDGIVIRRGMWRFVVGHGPLD